MNSSRTPSVSQIVVPAAKAARQPVPSRIVGIPIHWPLAHQWAPAWFYSAIYWLDKAYRDPSNVVQEFNSYLFGSDVDPYQDLGSTRLFMIYRLDNVFRLTIAADINSNAPLSGGTIYANSDDGIKQMYTALSTSSVFSSIKYCYIPCRVGSDLNPTQSDPALATPDVTALPTGYDTGTGLRSVVMGSAVSQVVPLDDFLTASNEQIYDDSPKIVPIVSALVYDVTQYNELGAATFVLPTFYARNQVTSGNFYVNKLGSSTTLNGANVNCGQSVVFTGGPGYDQTDATALTLKTSAMLDSQTYTFTTYNFDTAIVTTTTTVDSSALIGIMSLTYSSSAPASVFSQQQIIGFYRDSSWATCLGVPIYDYGTSNGSFTAAIMPLDDPTIVYDPTSPFLNGGSLQSVFNKLAEAPYFFSPDRLVTILDTAIAAKDTSDGAGLSVTGSGLSFDMTSTPSSTIVNQLTVPVSATVTTTPSIVKFPVLREEAPVGQQIGSAGNEIKHISLEPVTVQLGLAAFVPQEALSGTGIISLESGVAFPQQALGAGALIAAASAGTTVNLMAKTSSDQTSAPITLTVDSAGVDFKSGISYVLSLVGTTLTVRGSDGSQTSSSPILPAGNRTFTYVGAFVYSSAIASVSLYPKLQLTFPAPAVGTYGIEQGEQYVVRLTVGKTNSLYDVIDSTQTVIGSSISVKNAKPTDGSRAMPGDLYFGSFIGGSTNMTVWSVPIFVTLVPSQLTGVSFSGSMTVDTTASGLPSYQLQITDSSLFVYSNINVDTSAIGSVSSNNVYLSSAVINSSPDDTSPGAFAPCKILMGLIRQAQLGSQLQYVFVPEDDSVVIGGTRYMVSVINLESLGFDPSSLPYPPVLWPDAQLWQFANRHDPYLGIQYTGETETDRIAQAQSDTAAIGQQTMQAGEPMQLYIDTGQDGMIMWPIYEFPYDSSSQTIDQAQLKVITDNILDILATTFTTTTSNQVQASLSSEYITVPASLQQNNPYTADVSMTVATEPTLNTAVSAEVIEPSVSIGLPLTDLSPNSVANTSVHGLAANQSLQVHMQQLSTANFAVTKSVSPEIDVEQFRNSGTGSNKNPGYGRRYQSIYGFSVYNPSTGEAYIVEVVGADLTVFDQLPQPTQNTDYDPFYVRVVFLNTLTCYNMSIIVPSMAYDQYGHFAHQETGYQNLLSKTDEFSIGYMYSLYDTSNVFDNIEFSRYPVPLDNTPPPSETYVFTNLPYSIRQVQFNPTFYNPPAPYFVCRRQNWVADCHLMRSTHPSGSAIYLAFGAGDIVPLRLDADFVIDKRQPAHMYELTYTFADRHYDSAKTISVANTPYVVGVTTLGGEPQYMNFSINSTAGTADLQIGLNLPLAFPTDCYIVGQASTTLTSMTTINGFLDTALTDTGGFVNQDELGNVLDQQFQLIPYNNLVYLVRAINNVESLAAVGGLGFTSGLLVDTYVPSTTGNLNLAQAARYQRSGLSFFGTTYTPTTMVDTLDTLNFKSITGDTFYASTIFIPIPELDATTSFVADLSNFLGQQLWTFIYPEIVALPGTSVNGVPYPNGYNVDTNNKPVLSLQKLHFVYDPLVVMFTPNDLAHKYAVQPKQQVLALTNSQVQEGICWRSANIQPQRLPPTNICAQQILPNGIGMDRTNIVYSPQNRSVDTSVGTGYMGMSVNSFWSVSGVTYSIEESALSNDQVGTSFISAVSSTTNMLVSVLFDYDNNDLGTLTTYDPVQSTKGVVFLNGYLSATGYSFSSADHFDVNDVLPSQVPLLDQVAGIFGQDWDVAFYNTDVSLPRQFWSLVYDTFTAAGLPNYIANVPPPLVDPTFSNRTRSLILSLQNPIRPVELGLMDTYSSVVSANIHLQNGVTGSVFLSKKADRDVASIGTNPTGPTSYPLYGLPTKYDFFIFSRDHYWTLKGASFDLIDEGYAMCLIDDGSGTGTKVASYYIDADGNYYELYTYVLYSPKGGIIESSSFTLKVTLGAPANLSATPIIPETPNNVNPQDLVAQINKVSNLVYAAFGPSTPGQPPAYIPIQAIGGEPQAAPIMGAPGFNGYALNVVSANRQPVQISQIYSGGTTYTIAGPTTILPFSAKSGKAVPFYGSISHGLDRQWPNVLYSADQTSYIPRPTIPVEPSTGLFGGNGVGALTATPFSCAFQGSPAIPPAIASNPTPGTTMKADDSVFYTFNAVASTTMDSNGKPGTVGGGQYFVDATDPLNLIYGVVTLPKFTLNTNTYTINLSTTLSDGITSRYTLIVGGKSYQFGPDNAHVTVDRTLFTFTPMVGGIYTVTYSDIDNPTGNEAPTPITLTPFSIAEGGLVNTVDVFNNPGGLNNMILGVIGRQYTYNPIQAAVTVTAGAILTTSPLLTGLTLASFSGYGYVIGFTNGAYAINGSLMYPYSPSLNGLPAEYPLMTAPQMFTIGGNYYTFDQSNVGAYVSVTGNGQTYPVNPYQFSINGEIYIINTNVQPNTVVGGGNVYTMTAANTQFVLNGVQYSITLKQNSLNGATIFGQFNVSQGNVVVLEDYVYQLDTLNGQIVGNGTAYPLTTSGFTYTITTANQSFTVMTEANATTVTIGNVVYQINNTTVVGDGITYPILKYRTFVDGANTFNIGLDGTVSVPPPFALTGTSPYTGATFTDTSVYTVNELGAFDGTNYYLISGALPQFSSAALTYTLRTDGVSVSAGPAKTYIGATTGALSPNEFKFGSVSLNFGRPTDIAAFDGTTYFAVSSGQFTDSNTGLTYTLSGNTAVNEGNSYEIYSNLGQGAYFEVPSGPTYYVNITVADSGTPNGDIYTVFPITGGQFTIPLIYTVVVAGSAATVSSTTFGNVATAAPHLTAAGGTLTGGYFVDPVTAVVYTCVVDGAVITFVDTNNNIYPYPATGSSNTFVASVVVATGLSIAVDSEATPNVYPIVNNQFIVGTTTYTANLPISYVSASGPYFPMVNGRFIVPQIEPISSVSYTVVAGNVIKGYVISNDDEFSMDGNVVYTINAVNVVKATNQATLAGAAPSQTLTDGSLVYILETSTSLATTQPTGLTYNTASNQFTFAAGGSSVVYTVGPTSVTDNRHPSPYTFPLTVSGSTVTFTDTVSMITFTFDNSGDNPITVGYVYTNDFFVDVLTGVTYYIDTTDSSVEAISYVPESTQYAFSAADGNTCLIHYNDVDVVFPVISGQNVNAGVASVGSDIFSVEIDKVDPSSGGAGIPINQNSFEINGNLYTITGVPTGPNYSACQVVGDAISPKNFTSANTFSLTDPAFTYSLQLDSHNLPAAVTATFAVKPSRDLITVNDDVYIVTYNTVSTGSLLGQGQASIAITNSSFTLSNRFDATKAKFIFADADIYDSASVVGQFTAYLAPTFFIVSATYTLNPVTLLVTDNNMIPYPLIANPTMFSINGFNYVIDTNRAPHAIIGNNNVSPLSTDVTVQNGIPLPNSMFTVNGQIYAYTEDSLHNLLTITGTKSYMIAQPGLTFKLDSSLIFTMILTPPAAGDYAGTTVPIGTLTAAGPVMLNLYAGIPESGGADFFMYKNILYTFVKSEGTYIAIQKSYTVYVSKPAANQQQLAVFDLNGTTYLVTDGTTAGAPTPAGINSGTIWAETSLSTIETQFGLVYGFAAQPTNVSQSGTGIYQFQVTNASGISTLYNILYTAGSNLNYVQVDVPSLLPSFMQVGQFGFTPSYPLTFETGGYNAFTTFVSETSTPSESFSGAYKTPIISGDPLIDTLITAQGDFSLEFWHSIPVTNPDAYHPVTYSASTTNPLVYFLDIDFENSYSIYVGINNSVMLVIATPPVFSSGWRHVALTYTQPYVMLCQGAGFEVKQASNLNFNRDFSIAMTFSTADVTTTQGLLYKGTGSDNTSPQLSMSYRVAIESGAVTLMLTDGTSTISPVFTGPSIVPNQFYQIIIVKRTTTPASSTNSSDPYAPPFDVSDFGPAASNGAGFTASAPPTSGSGTINVSNIAPASGGTATPGLTNFLNNIQATPSKAYSVTFAVRTVNDDGSFGDWALNAIPYAVTSDAALIVNPTGSAHLLIGAAYDDSGVAMPLGGNAGSTGNIRDVYLFNSAINPEGITTSAGVVDIANAASSDLMKAGIVGYWTAQYDQNGVVNNTIDQTAVAISTNSASASLAPLTGHEYEGTSVYVNGCLMPLVLVPSSLVPSSMSGYSSGTSELLLNAGLYKLEEISMWTMARQAYQIIDDMFGRLVPTNEPFLIIYLSGSFQVQSINAPILPMNAYIDNIPVTNAVVSMNLAFGSASIDLQGCPAVGRCGPLVTPNLYTPPGVALLVCDTVPWLTTYSVTLNSVTGTLAGEINEAYVYIKNNVLTLYAGKKVGDLVLTWVSQEQGNVQMIGYVEGAPPCPMANLTSKPTYAGATSVTFTAPTSVTLKYQQGDDSSTETKLDYGDNFGVKIGLDTNLSPLGFGVTLDKNAVFNLELTAGASGSSASSNGDGWQLTASNKLDESNKYTVKMQGTLSPYTGDQFMAGLNALTTPSETVGNPSSKTAILPNPNLGGFTTSNPPGQLPKTAPTEEKYGQRMYVPSPYGQAFVTSQTLDVYQQTLVQSNTVYGFVRLPNAQIPRDLNIVSFRMNSQYIRPGCLDGVIGYAYNPATLPDGAQTYTTSTGQMEPVYDQNFAQGQVGSDASYMRVVEAYQIKKQIDQQAYSALALYQSAYNTSDGLPDSTLTPGLDFYNEYVWSSRGGSQEVKHTYTTTYEEVYTTTTINTTVANFAFNLKLNSTAITIIDAKFGWTQTLKDTMKYSLTSTGTSSFDIAAAFDGIETDTQMRYASNNDAHFVMNFNSTFNPNNQSGLNLVIGSDGLVYSIVPSVSSGAGMPISNNIDTSQTYMQPQPSYATGNADGLTGNLEPYDRPGKTNLFRTYAFFLQPTQQNADDFWSTVIDPIWLANSSDPDAAAMQSAQGNISIPWRLLYRVTYSERFLPPVSTVATVIPQITPVMAVPVLNPPTDFLFQAVSQLPRPAHNPANDVEANIVLVAPTASGLSVGTIPDSGPSDGIPILPNNVVPFDLVKNVSTVVNWGDTNNVKLLTQLITSVLGINAVPMSEQVLPGSTKVAVVLDPVGGDVLYTIYTDPNGATVNVPTNFGVIVYQDVNGNPIQYFDGKEFHALQADYIPTTDGTVMYYIQPPSKYDQTAFSLVGDYDLFGHPGEEWRYYLVSGVSSNMTSEATVSGVGPFMSSAGATPYTGFTIATAQHASDGLNQVQGYILVQGILQWPNLNTNAETFADVLVYKSMSLLDTFPIGDPEVMIAFLEAQYPNATFAGNAEINLVFARNIVSYFNAAQQSLIPQ